MRWFSQTVLCKHENTRNYIVCHINWRFLIQDKSLRPPCQSTWQKLRTCCFGCTVALRYSDLLNLRYQDSEKQRKRGLLFVCQNHQDWNPGWSQVTGLCQRHRSKAKTKSWLQVKCFKNWPCPRVNGNIRKVMELAGDRNRQTEKQDGLYQGDPKSKKWGGRKLLSILQSGKAPTTMRRTAIPLCLFGHAGTCSMKISGHSADGKTFCYTTFIFSLMNCIPGFSKMNRFRKDREDPWLECASIHSSMCIYTTPGYKTFQTGMYLKPLLYSLIHPYYWSVFQHIDEVFKIAAQTPIIISSVLNASVW